jgi:hypothetical protein
MPSNRGGHPLPIVGIETNSGMMQIIITIRLGREAFPQQSGEEIGAVFSARY